MNPSSQLCKDAHDHAEFVMISIMENKHQYLMDELATHITDIPLQDFMFLNQMVEINKESLPDFGEYNYYNVTVKMVDDSPQLSVIYPTMADGYSAVAIKCKGDANILKFLTYNTIKGSPVADITESKDKYDVRVKQFMMAMLLSTLSLFKYLAESDLHAVQSTGIQRRKHNARKPWQRTDLSSVQFLNRMPCEAEEHQGGTHQSPRYHKRRATKRRLTHNRFKNHPQYGKTIDVKASWVGKREEVINGTTYKVL